MICVRCHRPLKHPTATGMGRVCAAKCAASAPVIVERDLFGYDLAGAIRAAQDRLAVQVAGAVAAAHMDVKRQFRAARVALLGWQA